MSLTTTDKQDIKIMIKDGVADLENRVSRVEILLEDTHVDVKHMLGMLSDNLKIKPQLDNHEVRITDIEAIQPMLVSTMALHSQQLKG